MSGGSLDFLNILKRHSFPETQDLSNSKSCVHFLIWTRHPRKTAFFQTPRSWKIPTESHRPTVQHPTKLHPRKTKAAKNRHTMRHYRHLLFEALLSLRMLASSWVCVQSDHLECVSKPWRPKRNLSSHHSESTSSQFIKFGEVAKSWVCHFCRRVFDQVGWNKGWLHRPPRQKKIGICLGLQICIKLGRISSPPIGSMGRRYILPLLNLPSNNQLHKCR